MEVTTASKFPEKLSDAAGVMSVVTQDELRRFGAMTLREALERVPGLMALTSFFTDRSLVSVRGDQTKDNGSHVLILINGRPAREVLEGGIVSDLLQSFPVNILERIEVIRGPGSVLYGSNAFSGVINLITKKAVGSSAALRTYSVEPGAGGVSGELLFERGALNIAAAGQARYDPTWRTGYRSILDPAFQDVSLRDRGPGAYLGVNYKGLRFMGAYSEWQAGYFVGGTVGENRLRRGFTNLGYSLAVSPKWNMSFDLTHTLTRLAASRFPDIRRASSDTVLEWTNTIRPNSRDQITFGTLYDYVDGKERNAGVTPAALISQGTRHAAALYAQWDHQVSDGLKLLGGFQSNKTGPLAVNTVPRVGAIWSPARNVHVKALYGKAFRAPSINETRLNSIALIGNADLNPERIGTFDLGASYQANRFLAGFNYFDSRQSDIIFPAGGPLPLQYRNLGSVKIRGVELEGKYYVTERVFLYGSMLFNTRGGTFLPTPRWTASGGVSYQAHKTLTATLFDTFHSAAPGYPPTLNPAPAAYHMVNTHARLELSRLAGDRAKGIALFVHGANLGNRQIWLPDWGSHFNDTIPFVRGRTLYYGVEVALFRE